MEPFLLFFSALLSSFLTLSTSSKLNDHHIDDNKAAELLSAPSIFTTRTERTFDNYGISSKAISEGYVTYSYYRSDRGVISCGNFVYASTTKLNTCQAIKNTYYSDSSLMTVANGTTIVVTKYSDSKCQNRFKSSATAYAAGLCVESSDRTSMIRSVTAKISTDLTAPRVTLA